MVFIQKVTQFFNFGDSIRKCISVFYTDISARVNQGGNISDSFTLHRGCRQGDPLSPYIFILCAEILAIQIRNNNEIRGIKVRDKEYKLTLYADDSTLLLNGSERSLKVSLENLESFSKISGLHINYSKTEVIWIGSKIGSAEILCHNYNLEWGKTKFRLLGLNFNVKAILQVLIYKALYDKSYLGSKTTMTSGEWTCLISFATAPLTCSERGGSEKFKMKIYVSSGIRTHTPPVHDRKVAAP